MSGPSLEQIKAHAAKTAAMWTDDWKIYLEEIGRLTGLTIEQCFLFDMVLTWRDINYANRENMTFVRKHIEEEHGGDEPWKPGQP